MSKVVKLSDKVYYSIRDQWYRLKSCEFINLPFMTPCFLSIILILLKVPILCLRSYGRRYQVLPISI